MVRSLAYLLSVKTVLFLVFVFAVLCAQALPGLALLQGSGEAFWDFRLGAFNPLAMLSGSLIVSGIAMALAVPIGLGAAVFTSEFLTGRRRAFAKVSIELLAGIPSVVYGLLGVTYLTDWFTKPLLDLGGTSGNSLLTGGILLAVMILPTMMTFADDALRCVPRLLREASWGLGLTKTQTILHVVLPHAKTGILSAAMLALGRAIGETIAVFLVIGRADQPFSLQSFSFNAWTQAGQTVTSKLGGSEIAIAYGDPHHWSALMALAFCLWFVVGLLSFFSGRLFGRTERETI